MDKISSDLNLVFQNAKQYNKEESKIHQVSKIITNLNVGIGTINLYSAKDLDIIKY
jgi:hypothetical protein